ncbi:hypothetical protein PAPYR_7065 [Paratrimastix pyriformis]|uniref:Uncharacterized protein n=1 Tax=Paratrimastix pyriformis TaxID=342808 RepID=A0ABQ8UH24_9EUKA|nr:hypothetical protein PAPYR_7065 [Paratrimastix pyriformis]
MSEERACQACGISPHEVKALCRDQSQLQNIVRSQQLFTTVAKSGQELTQTQVSDHLHLLSLSHAIRQSYRGILREMIAFVEFDPITSEFMPTITADALSLPERWRGFTSEQAARWVDETFGGHGQLFSLALFPSLPDPAIERLLGHLPGLVELTVDQRCFEMNTHLLAALARSCPGLQVLRCSVSETAPSDHLAVLAPLSGVLKELTLGGPPSSVESLAPLILSLSAVTCLRLFRRCPPAVLEPIAPHLTSLELTHILCKEDLPGPWLCRLEELSLDLSHTTDHVSAPLARLLTENQATLRSLCLRLMAVEAAQPLAASLRALPHLTRLEVVVFGPAGCSLPAMLLPDVVDRLEHLHIELGTVQPDPVHITSSRLQQLHLDGHLSELELCCPALCPRLRTIRAPVESLAGVASMPMPDLEVAEFRGWHFGENPTRLVAGSPRLQVLSGVRLIAPDLLTRVLCACKSLHYDLFIQREDPDDGGLPQPLDLQVEAPRLLNFDLTIAEKSLPSARVWLHNCPSLVRLWLKSHTTLILQTDEDGAAGAPAAMQPRILSMDGDRGLEAASLLALLTRHGAPDAALSGLPRLANLAVNVSKAPSPLSLACPQLHTLDLCRLPGETKVSLACPLLEKLSGIRDPSRQLEFALPAPNLRL